MEKYDILVVGGSTTGSWFARRMAERGHKVLVIEKEKPDDVSRAYDIFHMSKKEMEQFGLEIPEEGSKEFGFFFEGSPMLSPYGNYPKKTVPRTIVGLHKHEYIMMMNDFAEKAGAQIIYGAAFTDFIREGKKIVGAKYKTEENRCLETVTRSAELLEKFIEKYR